MGCCASAASQISLPTNHKSDQQKNPNDQSQRNEGGVKQQEQREKYQDDQNQIQTHQQISKSISLQQISPKESSRPQNPYEYKEEQTEEQLINTKKQNENENADSKNLRPRVRQEQRQIKEFLQRKRLIKSLQKQNNNEHINIIEEVERQINNKQLNLDSLNEICQKYNKSLTDILSLMNQSNYYIIELILIYG